MMCCDRCLMPMVGVMSFSKDKREKFFRCKNCNNESKHKVLSDSELTFQEILCNRIDYNRGHN